MREGWEVKSLEEICDFQNGFAFKSNTFKDNGIPIIRITNIQNEKIDISKVVYIDSKDYTQDLTKYEVVKNDLLIAMSGATTGKIGIYDGEEKLLLNQRVGKFIPKNLLDKMFLFYYLATNVEENLEISVGSAQPNLSTTQIKNFQIPVPPLPEQKQIVKTLDRAFKQIDQAKANMEKNLANAKELFASKLNEVFSQRGEGWEEKRLQEVCEKITDGTHQTPKYFEKGIIFLSSRNVTSGKINWDNIKYIDEEQHIAMHKRVAPIIGDILLAKNGTTGVAAMVDRDVVFDIYVSLAHIRVLDSVLPHYMLHFINSPLAKKQFNARLKGTGVPNLHLKEIREVIIPFPTSLDRQNEIIEILNNFSDITERVKTHYQQNLNNIEELKKSILEKAFKGEL